MNAALRAKLMDPMVLNLDGNKEKNGKNGKSHKNEEEKKEKLKKMTKREAVEEEDEENEEDEVAVDRKGKPAGEERKTVR